MVDLSEVYSAILSTKLEEDHTSTYNDRLFGWFRSRYKCVFEGLEDPVFYRNFFTGYENENKFYYNYIVGLKDSEQEFWHKAKYHDDYLEELSTWFSVLNVNDPGKTWGVMTVPSSKTGTTNEITKLVRELLDNYKLSNFIDCTDNLYRTKDQVTTYEFDGWDISSNISTLSLRDPDLLKGFDNLVLIDEVVCTGCTMSAIKIFLNNNGINNVNIYNYAFGKSMSFHDVVDINDAKYRASVRREGLVKGIIYDLDQTLINSQHRNEEFEKEVRDFSNYYDNYWSDFYYESDFEYDLGEEDLSEDAKNPEIERRIESLLEKTKNVYEVYPEIVEECNGDTSGLFRFPFAIVADNSRARANTLAQTDTFQSMFYHILFMCFKTNYASFQNSWPHLSKHFIPSYYFNDEFNLYYEIDEPLLSKYTSFPLTNIFSGDRNNIYGGGKIGKIESVRMAKRWLGDGRIVGLGNTEEDMIAYHQAGLEACLALWGVHPNLRSYATKAWHADHIFNDFQSFSAWVNEERGVPEPYDDNPYPDIDYGDYDFDYSDYDS